MLGKHVRDFREILSLRPYQKEAIAKMDTLHGVLLFDDMGLGKSISSLVSVCRKLEHVDGRVLIVVPQNGLYVWKEQIHDWLHADSMVYVGTPKNRSKKLQQFDAEGTHFLITTYGVAKELFNRGWDALICDEIHQGGLLNHKTQSYKAVDAFCAKFDPLLYLLTGTPIRKGCIDLYAPLHLVDRKRFSNYWGYVNTYCVTIQTPFGKQIERNPRNLYAFREMLQHYMIRRLKTEVLQDLPGKQRISIPIEMSKVQQRAHQEIVEQFMYADEDSVTITPNKMTAIMRARQLLASPRILGHDDDGAGVEYIQTVGEDLLMSNQAFVVFTPFRDMLLILQDAILEKCPATHIYQLTGTMSPKAFAQSWQSFETDPCPQKVLLCTIKSGASFHATCASTCFFLGYEWDFNFNAQSEDRLCRLGQANFVKCYYLFYEGDTVDQNVKEKINDKQISANFVLGNDELVKCMLQTKK